MNTRTQKTLTTLALLGLAATGAHAQTASASNSAQVLTSGIKSATSGTSFFNVEGTGNTKFANYGVLDFSTTGFSGVTSLNNATVTLTLTESNTNFTAPGTIDFFLTTDTTTNDTPAISGGTQNTNLKFNAADTANGVGVDSANFQSGAQFFALGNGAFTRTGATPTGGVDNYTLNFADASTAARSYFLQQIGAGGPLRILVTPDANTPAVAATFAGSAFTSGTPAAPAPGSFPMLTIATPAAAPEPSGIAVLLIGMGALGLAAARRRTTQAA